MARLWKLPGVEAVLSSGKIFFQPARTAASDIAPERVSETGPAHRMPSTPVSAPRISMAGMRKIICLERDRIMDGTGLPIA